MDKATGRVSWTGAERDEMFRAYLTTALWSSTDDGESLDATHEVDDIAPDAVATLREDVDDFYRANRALLCAWTTPQEAGHLFWLNRNGHGVGFWDRTLPGAADTAEYRKRYGITRAVARSRVRFNAAMTRLSDASKVYGAVDLYVGDDGAVHVL